MSDNPTLVGHGKGRGCDLGNAHVWPCKGQERDLTQPTDSRSGEDAAVIRKAFAWVGYNSPNKSDHARAWDAVSEGEAAMNRLLSENAALREALANIRVIAGANDVDPTSRSIEAIAHFALSTRRENQE
jgi:hypothetical protein